MAPQLPAAVSSALALFSLVALSTSAAAVGHPTGGLATTRLHFYFHEISAGPDPSVVLVARANTTAASPASFGAVYVADNPLTEGPEPASGPVGRAQGMYAAASKERFATVMALNFVFTAGEFNGSTLAVLGRNPIFDAAREMPVVGGTGRFRLARGYALLRTTALDPAAGVATVEYDVTVFHPSI